MQVYMRNKRTGEFKTVEQDSAEMRSLQKERKGGDTVWEQTHDVHVSDVKKRASTGELRETDLGHDDQEKLPDPAGMEVIGKAEINPWENLTPGEIEAGLTPAQKRDDLEAMKASNAPREEVFEDASDAIADERVPKEERERQHKGQRARAGGSDERANVPAADASSQDDDSSSGSGGRRRGGRSGSQSSPSGGGSSSGSDSESETSE